ncbi:ribosomal protein [Musa troglodytarum]|uniref:Ribosomal protein n=1 Tax=Musa troglodytarum TaxID=320322 RepID=A0A9E7I830_9LILI|nr:ribosomal protein [Musa troglodytarum]
MPLRLDSLRQLNSCKPSSFPLSKPLLHHPVASTTAIQIRRMANDMDGINYEEVSSRKLVHLSLSSSPSVLLFWSCLKLDLLVPGIHTECSRDEALHMSMVSRVPRPQSYDLYLSWYSATCLSSPVPLKINSSIGYAMECSISMRGTGTQLAKAGYAVYGIDYEGHGKSSGLQGFVPMFDELVNDVSEHFTSICERRENKTMMRYLLGESMGGAVALHLHRKKPTFWDGAVLVAPMCKISEEMKPNPLVILILTLLGKLFPTWKIIPTEDIIDKAVKNPEWRMEIRNNPYCYKGKPRLKTGIELLKASLDVQSSLEEVSLPFLIVHGGDDSVTDPSVSQSLYESASSDDRSFKLYPGMWHALTSGEPQENIVLVFSDIIAWLDERTIPCSFRTEREHKIGHDPKLRLS